MIETEVPPRNSDYPQLVAYLSRHAVIHFAISYCYWFTALTAFDDLQARFLGIWPTRSNAYHYLFALWMTAIFYYFSRRRMRATLSSHASAQPASEHDTNEARL